MLLHYNGRNCIFNIVILYYYFQIAIIAIETTILSHFTTKICIKIVFFFENDNCPTLFMLKKITLKIIFLHVIFVGHNHLRFMEVYPSCKLMRDIEAICISFFLDFFFWKTKVGFTIMMFWTHDQTTIPLRLNHSSTLLLHELLYIATTGYDLWLTLVFLNLDA